MAKFENMTLSYTQIASIPFKVRKSASGSLLDALSRELTPGQRVALFPSYVNEIYSSAKYEAPKEGETTPLSGGGGTAFVPPTVEKYTPTKKETSYGAGSYPSEGGKYTGPPISGNKSYKKTDNRNQKAILDFARRWNISPEAAAGVLKVESGIQTNIRGGAGDRFYGVFQLEDKQIPELTKKAGFGELTEEQYKQLSIEDQLKVMDQYYHKWGITPSFFTGDPKKDTAKMWALQLAPAKADNIDYDDPNAIIATSDQADLIEVSDGKITVGSSSGSLNGGVEYFADIAEQETVSEETGEATAEPLGNNPRGAESIVPAGAENDAIIDPESRVVQLQKEVAETRKGPLDPDLNNLLGLTAQKTSELTGRNLKFKVTSGGQRMAEAPGAVGTHEHDKGGAADFNIIESLPDGTEKVLDPRVPADKLIINQAVETFAQSGGRSVGSEYMSDPTKLHFGISRNNPAAYLGTEDFKDAFDKGRSEYLEWADANQVDESTGFRDVYREEKVKREEVYKKQSENTSQQLESDPTSVPLEEPPASSSEATANTQTSKSTSYTMGELTGTDTGTLRTVPGVNAAAGGAEITEPSMIISEDGKKVTRVAETGPEKISVMPRHKSSDVYQEDRTFTQEMQREVAQENLSKRDIAEQKYDPMPSNFGQQRNYGGQTTFINTDMPKVPPSANKAFADAKLVSRFNKADIDGDMGIVYVDRGYA